MPGKKALKAETFLHRVTRNLLLLFSVLAFLNHTGNAAESFMETPPGSEERHNLTAFQELPFPYARTPANAKIQDKEAQFQRALRYKREQNGRPPNLLKTRKWLAMAANQGHTEAQYELGILLKANFNRPEDALYWLEQAACQQHREAQYQLAGLLKYLKHPKYAIHWFYQAACQNHREAQYELGILLKVDRNRSGDALYWLEQAARQNHREAQYELEDLLESLNYPGKAVQWLYQAACQEHTRAQMKLGYRFRDGKGVRQDYISAVYWFEKASADPALTWEAQTCIGWFYLKGLGVSKDEKKAFELYFQAAQAGYFPAQLEVGILYEEGWGVEKNLQVAVNCYAYTAGQGYAPAQWKLGILFAENDPEIAKYWFEMGAKQGYAPSQSQLAALYKRLGGEANLQMAHYWYGQAGQQGGPQKS